MSGRLGAIPYPLVDPRGRLQTDPLVKYQNQLQPLGQVTQGSLPPLPPPVVPVSPHPLAMAPLQHATAPGSLPGPAAMPSAAMMPSHAETMPGPMPLGTPGPRPGAPPGAPPGLLPAGPTPGAAMLRSAAPGMAGPHDAMVESLMPPGLGQGVAEDDPHGLTQYARSPTGGLTRMPGAGPGSAQLGAEMLDEGRPAGEPPTPPPEPFKAPTPTPGMWQPKSRDEERVNTALASETGGRNPHLGNDKQVGLEMAKAAKARPGQQSYFEKAAGLIRQHFGDQIDFSGANTHEEISERFINHMKDNLLDVWNRVPGEWKERAKLWYVGANKIAHDWANEYGYHPRQMAGALAALSPATDWLQNVALAKRVIETVRDHQGTMTTDKMLGVGQKFVDAQKVDKVKAAMQAQLDDMKGKTFGELKDDKQRALWIRWHDTAHADRSYRNIMPEGYFGDTMRNKPKKGSLIGDPATSSFLYTDSVLKALRILGDGSLENVSRNVGSQHKVRSFYNNIIAPHSKKGDITGDTHAIAAALLQPLGQSHATVELGLGGTGPGSAEGLSGLYPWVAEAYRRAAKRAKVLPREFQSVTWEGGRGIFSAPFKRAPNSLSDNMALWKLHSEGKLSVQKTRDKIYEAAGAPVLKSTGRRGPRPPPWHTGSTSVEE